MCLNKPFDLFKYSAHIPFFIWNNERRGETGQTQGENARDDVRKELEREREREESGMNQETTKCNLSDYSDKQCLKWELTENGESAL